MSLLKQDKQKREVCVSTNDTDQCLIIADKDTYFLFQDNEFTFSCTHAF
jgi:hypothetical protein